MKKKKKLNPNRIKLGGFTSETCCTQSLLQNCLKYSEKLAMWFLLRLCTIELDRSMGFAFITMASVQEAKEAIRMFNGSMGTMLLHR
ncbi:hypothetical protein L6452_07481 [Arctium lappa]|uniref:Uncharacterized protein n=1 Tax=Arctium lappa TaxID=4217 RepID=A0ACB9ELQ7_ARCLA|nr:hypothetical protein L6452_07481 [Arctium lappa]